MLYFTSDPHGDFEYIAHFANEQKLSPKDTIMLLGDACFHRFGDGRDEAVLDFVSENIPAKFLTIRGNHDMNPLDVGCTPDARYGAEVLVDPAYPSISYALDGETYSFEGTSILAIGGAYTIEPAAHLAEGYPVFNDTQPGAKQWRLVEEKLEQSGWHADIVATHTCPAHFMTPSLLHSEYNQSTIDHSFEEWLDSIEKQIAYHIWIFGHFHKDMRVSEKALCLCKRIVSIAELLS